MQLGDFYLKLKSADLLLKSWKMRKQAMIAAGIT